MSLIADALRQAQQERETPNRRREDAVRRILAGRSGAVGPGSWLRAPRPGLPGPLLMALGLFTTAALGTGALVAWSLRPDAGATDLVAEMTTPHRTVVASMMEAGQVDSIARAAQRTASVDAPPPPPPPARAGARAPAQSSSAPPTGPLTYGAETQASSAAAPSAQPETSARQPVAASVPAIRLVLAPAHAAASELVRAGVAAQRSGDDASAERLFRQALAEDPRNAEAANDLGIVLQGQGELTRARDSFRSAVAAQPRYVTAWSNLGAVLSALGEMDEAKTALAEAARLDPGNMGAKVNLAILYQRQQLPDEAARILLEVLAVEPGMPEAHYALAQAREQQGDRAAAVVEYRLFLSSSGGRFPEYERTVRQRLQRLEGAPDVR